MYIYELPFDINRELCRLLDNDDDWKELAGIHMKYSPFDIAEIEQIARRHGTSPTLQLFTRWGQLNHRVEELFILLYRMRHIPAQRCLLPVVDSRFHKLLSKRDCSSGARETRDINENNKQPSNPYASSIPLHVMLIEKGLQLPTTGSNGVFGNSPSDVSSTDDSASQSHTKGNDMCDELMKNVTAIPMSTYTELVSATDSWSERNLLGTGGYGQVYKGLLNHLPVAVKRLRDNDGKNKELIREMCLNQYRHDNILPLYGYSLGGPEACLVYQLMAGGSLEQRLRCKTAHPPLSWSQRHRIAHGVARGLQYLHTKSETLIHGDIKPANILLDQCTVPKIGDFGLARKGPNEDRTHMKVSKVHGTRPYLPEEYLRSRCLSTAVDVFSFGVVALELATRLPVLARDRNPPSLHQYLHDNYGRIDLASLEDKVLLGTPNSNPELVKEFINIGLHCTKYSRKDRPSMLEVYKKLDSMEFVGKIID